MEQEQIKQARRADLPTYLAAKGEVLKREGRGYRHSVHDSLKIEGNMYCWNSKGTSGNALDFVQEFYGLNFRQAVEELTGEAIPAAASVERPALRQLVLPERADNARRVFAYLIKTRKIAQAVVQHCFDEHIVYQDEKGNCVFLMVENGNVVGGELCGTTETRFKGVLGGSKFGAGVSIKCGTKTSRMCLFESVVDMLSYKTLYNDKLTGHLLVSMAGLKEQTALTMAAAHSVPMSQVWCCVDRDEAGREFAEMMAQRHGSKKHLPPESVKDWNDVLKGRVTA